MKKLLVVLLFAGSAADAWAQADTLSSNMMIVVNKNYLQTPPYASGNYFTYHDIAPELAGQGVHLFNIQVDSFGRYNGYGGSPFYDTNTDPSITLGKFVWKSFAASDIGIDSGMVLGTGRVFPGNNPLPYHPIPGDYSGINFPAFYNTGYDYPGGYCTEPIPITPLIAHARFHQYPDLVALNHGDSIADANILEFDFVPDSDHIALQYVFASEEYPNSDSIHRYPVNYPSTVCDTATDVMGIFLSGPGIEGEKNIALVPGTNIPVGVNTITPPGYNCNSELGGGGYSQYYVDNSNGQNVIYNGFTTVLTAHSVVIPSDTYHLRIAVADGAPHHGIPYGLLDFDSGIFLKFGSLVSYSDTTTGTDTSGVGIREISNPLGIRVYPNPFRESFQIVSKQNSTGIFDVTLSDLTGREIIRLSGKLSKINQALSVKTTQLLPGVYFLNIRNGNGDSGTFKAVKIK